MKHYTVALTGEERALLLDVINKGKGSAQKIKHANIMLAIDKNNPDGKKMHTEVAQIYHCHKNTVMNIAKTFVRQGLDAALERKKRMHPPIERLLDGEGEARLILIACSTPPEGRSRWTLQMLADELVRLEVVESISPQTVQRTLKKMSYVPI